MRKLVAALLLLSAPAGAWAGALDLSLGDETANLVYVFNEDPLNSNRLPSQNEGSEVSLGIFFNEESDNVVHATLLARGYRDTTRSQYQVSAGMRLIGGNINVVDEQENIDEEETVGALALGFQAGLLLKPGKYNPVDLMFEGFYAPSITSFSDAERYGEVSVRLQMDIMTRARAYIGYRRIRFDTNDFENITLDRNAHVGLSISF